jgi:hypothetical protein
MPSLHDVSSSPGGAHPCVKDKTLNPVEPGLVVVGGGLVVLGLVVRVQDVAVEGGSPVEVATALGLAQHGSDVQPVSSPSKTSTNACSARQRRRHGSQAVGQPEVVVHAATACRAQLRAEGLEALGDRNADLDVRLAVLDASDDGRRVRDGCDTVPASEVTGHRDLLLDVGGVGGGDAGLPFGGVHSTRPCCTEALAGGASTLHAAQRAGHAVMVLERGGELSPYSPYTTTEGGELLLGRLPCGDGSVALRPELGVDAVGVLRPPGATSRPGPPAAVGRGSRRLGPPWCPQMCRTQDALHLVLAEVLAVSVLVHDVVCAVFVAALDHAEKGPGGVGDVGVVERLLHEASQQLVARLLRRVVDGVEELEQLLLRDLGGVVRGVADGEVGVVVAPHVAPLARVDDEAAHQQPRRRG